MSVPQGVLAKMFCAIVFEDGHKPIPCIMYYSSSSPFEVVFSADEETEDGEPSEWRYSRELLAQAVHGDYEVPYGEGDVQIFKDNEFLFTLLSQGMKKCLVAFQISDMEIFLSATTDLVPLGSESTDVDAAIAALLETNDPPF
jgi:hypothetical protein